MSVEKLLPCPFCGSEKLTTNGWWIGDDGEEWPAVECEYCLAGAPAKVWNNRPTTTLDKQRETT